MRIVVGETAVRFWDLAKSEFVMLEEYGGKVEKSAAMEICENSEYLSILKDKEESEKIARVDLDLFMQLAAKSAYVKEKIVHLVVNESSIDSYSLFALSNLGYLYGYTLQLG